MSQICFKVPKIYNQTTLNLSFMHFSFENFIFTIFSGIIKNPVVSVWYYHLPFLSNIETQVKSGLPSAIWGLHSKILKVCMYISFKVSSQQTYITMPNYILKVDSMLGHHIGLCGMHSNISSCLNLSAICSLGQHISGYSCLAFCLNEA